MTDRSQHGSHKAFEDIKSGVHGIKGFGDAIRGTFNESIDHAFHETEGEAKNKSIADRGVAEMKASESHFDHEHHQHTGGITSGSASAISSTTPTTSGGQRPLDHQHGPRTGGVGTGLGPSTATADTRHLREGTMRHHQTNSNTSGAHSGAVGNMESSVPQERLGGDATETTNRF